jgi:hypothetical protein
VQLTDILHSYAMPESWAQELETMLAADEKKVEQSSGVFIADAQTRVTGLQGKLKRLLDNYLDQDIDQLTYKTKQAELMSDKKSLEEQISKLTLANNIWVEPMRNWLKQAVSLCEIAKNGSFEAKKNALLQIEGLNLFLKTKKAQPTAAPEISPPLKNPWHALRATKEKAARAGDDFRKSFFLAGARGIEPRS